MEGSGRYPFHTSQGEAMTTSLGQRRKTMVAGVLALLMAQAMMASAATVKTGPYDKAHTVITTNNDPAGVNYLPGADYLLGYATATASANVDGTLSARATAYSGILPHGAIISGPVRVNAYDATASAVITQKLLVTGSGSSAVQANFTSVGGSTDYYGPSNYCYPSSKPECQVEAYRRATLPPYSFQVNSLLVATYYPCQWTSVNPTCSLTSRQTVAKNFSNLSLTATVNKTSAGAGTIVVNASLVATATAKGGYADVWVSGTLSDITLTP